MVLYCRLPSGLALPADKDASLISVVCVVAAITGRKALPTYGSFLHCRPRRSRLGEKNAENVSVQEVRLFQPIQAVLFKAISYMLVK